MEFDCKLLRKTVIEMAYAGSTVHIGCAFSLIEILAVLYRSHLYLGKGSQPDSPDRDYLVLSKGHGVMAQYACLRELGWITDHEIYNYCSDGTHLKGLSDAHVPGLEVTSGSLGHGLSVGVGMALGAKRLGSRQRCYAIISDGELNEGTTWEAFLFANHFELSNLIVIVDQNGFQAMGSTNEVMRLGDVPLKLRSFGFETCEVDGHDENSLDLVLTKLKNSTSCSPKAIVAKTIKGKGVSFMENDNRWHYTRLNDETFKLALSELV